ncbi:monodechloroaminopyrrolnitrin synthase PrnB family protein [Actinokineospora sp. G85]|uniref:monodechloroaminopyrrolnitrin synthase PrnB family protein n=1 Tax=Actinokineospora sp. G85 TaxID=3406626 RepID=UPI003C71118D
MPTSDSLMHGNEIQIERVRSLDPLAADKRLARLPQINAASDIRALSLLLGDLLPDPGGLAAFDTDHCIAAMRDLGMVLGSIKRHGQEPLAVVPRATPVLIELGARTDMVPRDVVHHYCTWNPTGDRERMYTGDGQERYLQDSVRMVFPHLRAALELCHILQDCDPRDTKFAVLLDALNREVAPMIDSIDLVLEHVSPRYFARDLRPYFEEVVVDGATLLGPAAAQVPLWLVDEVVWASDRSSADYLGFVHHSVPYSLPRWRELHDGWVGTPSLVTRVLRAHEDEVEHAATIPALRASAKSLASVLRTVTVFRGRHMGIARQAYQEDLRLYPVGSGGASVDLLREIIDLTRENAHLVKAMGQSRRPVGAGTA